MSVPAGPSVPFGLGIRLGQREHLLSRSRLMLLALSLVLVLVLVAPTPQGMLEDMAARADYLSLPYLKLWTSLRPNDQELKLRLAQTFLRQHRADEAAQLLESLGNIEPRLRSRARRLSMQTHMALISQDPGRLEREPELKAQLLRELDSLIGEPLSVKELLGLAATCLGVGQPDLAARVYLRLSEIDAERHTEWLVAAAQQAHASGQPALAGELYDELVTSAPDPQAARGYALLALSAFSGADQGGRALATGQRYAVRFSNDVRVLQATARLALSNGQPAAAAQHYDTLVQLSSDLAERRAYAKLALSALIMADSGDAALATAKRYLSLFPNDQELLRLARKLAMGNGQARLRQEWGRALLAQDPQNSALLAEQIDAELAVGDAAAALALAQRLLSLHPHSTSSRVRLAEIAEWTGRPHIALAQWAALALRNSKKAHLDRALKMAPQLYDMELLAKLLAVKAQRGRLENSELLSLAETYDSIGEPEQLIHILKNYLRRYPEHCEAWEVLADVQERSGDLDAALATTEHMTRKFGSILLVVTRRAELLWQLNRTSESYVLLRDALDHSGIASTEGLLMRSELTVQDREAPLRLNRTEQDQEQEKQKFLSLLAEVFWYSEPQPQPLEEYRILWRAGALLSQSASRYIRLAEDRGHFDEAMAAAESAFVRYDDPEFLLWALAIAMNSKHYDTVERLIATAREHAAKLAANKQFHAILAEYYAHRGDLDRAQREYFKLLELDPSSVAARASLLWLLINQSSDPRRARRSREMLRRLLAAWRQLAQDEPALWLPFASAYTLIGSTTDAAFFYRREWTRRPDDHLWLLGYAAVLDALSRSSDAREIRRFALAELRKDALRAAHKGASQSERELLRAYVQLVRDTYGPGKGSRWLSEVLHKGLDFEVQLGIHTAWHGKDRGTESSAWVMGSSDTLRKNPWGRYRKAPRQDRMQALALHTSDVSADAEEPPPAPLLVLESEAVAGENKIPENLQQISIESEVQSVNELFILSTSVSGLVARGSWALSGRIGWNQLFLNPDEDPQAGTSEVDLSLHGMWRHRLGRLDAAIGANLRADANLISGWLKETFNLGRGGTLQLGAYLNELTYDSRWLRIYGARHRVTAGWSQSFLRDAFVDVQADIYQYHTRTNEDLGAGVNASAFFGYRIRRLRPLVMLRTSMSFLHNFHLSEQVSDLGGSSSYALPPSLALPKELATFGIGSRIVHRFPGVAPIGAGRWRYMGDVWLGFTWPLNVVVFEMRAGVALALPRRQELSLTGFVANNRWLGPGVVNAGLTLRYLFR